MKDLFSHIADQYPPEIRRQKYEYWVKLKRANEEYRQNNHHDSFQEEKAQFEQWMLDQWGIDVQVEDNGYTPYYTVADPNKYLLFLLKYD